MTDDHMPPTLASHLGVEVDPVEMKCPSYPFWMICKATHKGHIYPVAQGLWLSHAAATAHLEAHRYGRHAFVLCFSGWMSHDWRLLAKALRQPAPMREMARGKVYDESPKPSIADPRPDEAGAWWGAWDNGPILAVSVTHSGRLVVGSVRGIHMAASVDHPKWTWLVQRGQATRAVGATPGDEWVADPKPIDPPLIPLRSAQELVDYAVVQARTPLWRMSRRQAVEAMFGVGPATADAMCAAVGVDPGQFVRD